MPSDPTSAVRRRPTGRRDRPRPDARRARVARRPAPSLRSAPAVELLGARAVRHAEAERDRHPRAHRRRAGRRRRPGLAGRTRSGGPRRPPVRDHRSDGTEDGDQRAELRREGVAGRPRGRQHPALAQRHRGAGRAPGRGASHAAARPRATARSTSSPPTATWRSSSPAPAGGTSTNATSRSTASRCRAASSTRRSTCSTTPTEQLARGSGPYLYLAKLESADEAALWRDVLTAIEEHLGLAVGTVRVTVLIETITAALELEAILHELRPHITALNAGRWDYLFSFIKVFRSAGPEFVLPDRADVPMTVPFMRAYTELLVVRLPPAGRARHRRHVRLHPEPARPGGDRARAHEGPCRQGTRGRRRLRRVLGRPPRPRRAVHRGVHRGVRRA